MENSNNNNNNKKSLNNNDNNNLENKEKDFLQQKNDQEQTSFSSFLIEHDCLDDDDDDVVGRENGSCICSLDDDNTWLSNNENNDSTKNISIDYMAKDYSSFRQALSDLVSLKAPKWQDKTEANTGIMLADLYSYVHDELSYLQDRIINEAFLPTATQRSSIKNHLALIDYYLYEGCSANSYLKIKALQPTVIPAGFQVSTNTNEKKEQIVFETISDRYVDPKHNEINISKLGVDKITGQPFAILEKKYPKIKKGQYILFENLQNKSCEIVQINQNPTFIGTSTKITWSTDEKLRLEYDLQTDKVCANIIKANHGKTVPQEILKEKTQLISNFTFKLKNGPLTFISDSAGSIPYNTLNIWVDGELWKQTDNLFESGPFNQFYSFSIGNDGLTDVTFGNGVFGLMPSDYSFIEAQYRFQMGSIGNVGKNTLTKFDFPSNPQTVLSLIDSITNPLPAFGGNDPQSIEDAKIQGPKSLKIQQRAVVLSDYENLVFQKFPHYIRHAKAVSVFKSGIRSNSSARGGGGGGDIKSVFIYLDAKAGIKLDSDLLMKIKEYIDTIKLIGYSIHVESANYIPIEIAIDVFITNGFNSIDIRNKIKMSFSSKNNLDGSKGFFHADNFGFGDYLFVSKLFETLKKTPEVKYGIITKFKKLDISSFSSSFVNNNFNFVYSFSNENQDRETRRNLDQGYIPVDKNEIIRLDNDPLIPQNGILTLNFVEDQTENNTATAAEDLYFENGVV
jgi:hypothetical protein